LSSRRRIAKENLMPRDLSSPEAALAFVEKHGVMLESGRGAVPSLADAIAGEPLRGSWWGHPKGREIFRATRHVRDSDDVLVCRLLDGKITYVHRRLWPALVRLAGEIGEARLDAIREEHTKSGAHKLVSVAFPTWVPLDIAKKAKQCSETEARKLLGEWLNAPQDQRPPAKKRKRAR
jgi:hypothetical protein